MKVDLRDSISHDVFLELLSPNFDSKVDKTDIMAVLKRTHVVVLGDNAVYLRVAGELMTDVMVVRYLPEVELLDPDCKEELGKFKEGNDTNTGRFGQGLEWSLKFLGKVTAGEPLDLPVGN
eukprot:1205921-Amphidinium_carterae.1